MFRVTIFLYHHHQHTLPSAKKSEQQANARGKGEKGHPPSNLNQRRPSRILPNINHLPSHNILNQRPHSANRLPITANGKHQLPIHGDPLSSENRRRDERRLPLLELGDVLAHCERVHRGTVHEDLVLEGVPGFQG